MMSVNRLCSPHRQGLTMRPLTICALAISLVTACDEPTRPAMTPHVPKGPGLALIVAPPIDLGTLGGSFSTALAINALGQVVGYSAIASNLQGHAFMWRSGTGMTDLGTLGGTFSQAVAVNALGQVVGNAALASGFTHGFSWQSGQGMVDIGTLGGVAAQARAINVWRQVVGNGYTAGGEDDAFSWR